MIEKLDTCDLGVTNNAAESAGITNNIESLLITALEFVIYGLAALLIYQ